VTPEEILASMKGPGIPSEFLRAKESHNALAAVIEMYGSVMRGLIVRVEVMVKEEITSRRRILELEARVKVLESQLPKE
jgi:hypothetical protein